MRSIGKNETRSRRWLWGSDLLFPKPSVQKTKLSSAAICLTLRRIDERMRYLTFLENAMSVQKTNTLVIGAGQAGIAMSEHLGAMGIDHIVLERKRIAERWRSERWDSLVANGPAWHDRFPSLKFDDIGADVFPPKERMAQYFEDYARMINA